MDRDENGEDRELYICFFSFVCMFLFIYLMMLGESCLIEIYFDNLLFF